MKKGLCLVLALLMLSALPVAYAEEKAAAYLPRFNFTIARPMAVRHLGMVSIVSVPIGAGMMGWRGPILFSFYGLDCIAGRDAFIVPLVWKGIRYGGGDF